MLNSDHQLYESASGLFSPIRTEGQSYSRSVPGVGMAADSRSGERKTAILLLEVQGPQFAPSFSSSSAWELTNEPDQLERKTKRKRKEQGRAAAQSNDKEERHFRQPEALLQSLLSE